MDAAGNYPLGYTDDEAQRLIEQAAYFEDLTVDVLRRAGLESGMRVLDLGCGVGDVSLLAAQMVGTAGSVLGIDRNRESVEIARRRVAKLHIPNVSFAMTELDDFNPEELFDAIIGRLVLLYQPDPAATLRRFAEFLRPNGIVACQEIDIDMSQFPGSELFNNVRSWIVAALKAGGAEPKTGSKLLQIFLAAGLPRPTMIAGCRVESGPDSVIYEHHAQILRSLMPLGERAGIISAAEVAIDTLASRLRQEAIESEQVIFESRLVGAWSRLRG
jgi:cyclopropane fatty-acyl-phospholipid synthase-like methyltransferase